MAIFYKTEVIFMSSKVACLYIRVSTEDQTELSPDAQKRLLLDYAQKNDMTLSLLKVFPAVMRRSVRSFRR